MRGEVIDLGIGCVGVTLRGCVARSLDGVARAGDREEMVMESKRSLVMPWWAWAVVGLLWFEVENERRLRLIGYRLRALLA